MTTVPTTLVMFWGRKGGGAKYSAELLQGLVGFSPNAVHASFSTNAEVYDDVVSTTSNRFDIRTYDSLFEFLWRSMWLPVKLVALYYYLKKNKIQLVFTTMIHIWTPLTLPVYRLAGVRHVVVIHDATSHPGDYLGRVVKWMNRLIIGSADAIVVLSRHVEVGLQEIVGIDSRHIIQSTHGLLSYPNLDTQAKSFSESNLKLVFFGRILPYKGLELLLIAVLELQKRLPEIELEIWGDGGLESYKGLLGQIRRLRLENRWISNDEIGMIYSKPCLNIAPYIEASQSGTIPIATSCGIPTICTDVGGLREQVCHQQTGIVVPIERAVENMVEAIEALYYNRQLLGEMSENCVSYAHEKLSWEGISQHLAEELSRRFGA